MVESHYKGGMASDVGVEPRWDAADITHGIIANDLMHCKTISLYLIKGKCLAVWG